MADEVKFCPARKTVKKILKREKDGSLAAGYNDDFKKCLMDRCMAYQDGKCMKYVQTTERG